MNTRLGSTRWKMNLLDVEMSILRWIVRRGLLTCAGSDRRSHFKGSVRSNTPLSLSLVLHTTTTAIYYFYNTPLSLFWCTLPSLVLHISTVQIYKTLPVFVWTILQYITNNASQHTHTQCADMPLYQIHTQCFCVSASFFILYNYDNTYSIAAEYPFAGEAAQHWIIQYSRSTVTEM